jgi:hypothetical protein
MSAIFLEHTANSVSGPPKPEKANFTQIEKALCFKQKSTVAKDHTVFLKARSFKISSRPPYSSHADKRIDVHAVGRRRGVLLPNKKSFPSTPKQRTQLAYIKRS